MKRINTHHFPQNPYQEQQTQYRFHPYHFNNHHHHHHHGAYHRRHSFVHSHYGTGGSHYGSLHVGHPHHSLLSSLANRTLKTNFDLVRLSRVRDQLSLPVTTTTGGESNENNAVSSADDQSPPTPATPQPLQVPQNTATSNPVDDERLLKKFLTEYLSRDGILVLYILQMNTNEVITSEIVLALFELYKSNSRTETVE